MQHACGILVLQPQIEPGTPALGTWSLTHLISREDPHMCIFKPYIKDVFMANIPTVTKEIEVESKIPLTLLSQAQEVVPVIFFQK